MTKKSKPYGNSGWARKRRLFPALILHDFFVDGSVFYFSMNSDKKIAMAQFRTIPESPPQPNASVDPPASLEAHLERLKELNRMEKLSIHEVEAVLDWLRETEILQRKFYALESRILSILNLQDFFEILLTEMGRIFQVPCVWLSVIKKTSLANLINPLIHSRIILQKTQFLDRQDFDRVFGDHSTPLLFNQNLSAQKAILPGGGAYHRGSISLAPVQIDGEIVGSLNQWDPSPDRFEPDRDTSFLEQLMMKVSLCLSNVAAHERLKYFAFHDPLTGLWNRRALESHLHREFSRARRHGHPLSLVFMDLDKFKQINDQHGHDAGDDALVYVAETISTLIRDEDFFARFAGDEFVLILPETTEAKAGTLMGRVQACLDDHPLERGSLRLPLSISYGIASVGDAAAQTAAALLKSADNALYAEKEKKRSRPGD